MPAEIPDQGSYDLDLSGNADIYLTLRINNSRPEIRVEKGERQNNRIHRSQVIGMSKERNQANAEVIVTGHPLIIPFDALFHRQPVDPGGKDPKISEQELEALAGSIWEEQGCENDAIIFAAGTR